jgi:hypothetical protein
MKKKPEPPAPVGTTVADIDDPAVEVRIELASRVSARTKQGFVELYLRSSDAETRVQLPLPKAREIAGMFSAAIEAAVSDELLFRFLVVRIGLPPEAAGAALVDFREMRQGSRETVYPQ